MHYNFPPLSHPGSKALMVEVLNNYFSDKDGPKPWHFDHTSRLHHGIFGMRSKVMQRHDAADAKHAFLC